MKTLSRNITAIGGSDLTRKLFGFLSITYLTRHITVSDFGLINIGLTALSYILILSGGGLPTLGTREVARSASTNLVGRILSTRIVLTLVTMAVVCLIAYFFVTNPPLAAIIILISISALPNALFLDWYFQGKEAMSVIGLARGVSAIINFVMIVLFVKQSGDILRVAFAAIVSDSVACLIYFLFSKKEFHEMRFDFNLTRMKGLLGEAFPLGIGSILAHVSINFAPLFLGIAVSTRSVGIFSAAMKLVFFLMLFDRILATILLPATSRIYSREPERFLLRLEEAQKWIFLIALPICAGGSLLSSDIVQFIFGKAYVEAATVFSVLIWFLFLTMTHTIYNAGLVATGREKDYAKVMVYSSIFYFSSIIAGTTAFGELGTAVGLILAETISVILSGSRLLKNLPLKVPDSTMKIFTAVVFMGLIIKLLPDFHVLLLIMIGASVYLGTILSLRVLTKGEFQSFGRRIL